MLPWFSCCLRAQGCRAAGQKHVFLHLPCIWSGGGWVWHVLGTMGGLEVR